MKKFKTYIFEEETGGGPISNVKRTKERQDKEKSELDKRHEKEIIRAREQDFRKRENDRRVKQIQKDAEKRAAESLTITTNAGTEVQISEYVEDGTDEMVDAYLKCVPGQSIGVAPHMKK